MQKNAKVIWPWIVVIGVVGGGGYLLLRDRLPGSAADADAAAVTAPAAAASATPHGESATDAAPATTTAPVVKHPIDESAAADPALPALADSDASVWTALADAMQGSSVVDVLLRDHLLQRWVTHIDNLDKPSLAPVAMAAKPLPGTLQVEASASGEQIAPGNAARYSAYVTAFSQLDPDVVARVYVRFYPLIQQAYVDLGRKDAYFNDRLVAVIDHLLATPEPARPLQVERDERGRYRFVDATLQARSVGQKLLLRMDAAQAQSVKKQLRAIRRAVTHGVAGG